jgi:hypothetical protein
VSEFDALNHEHTGKGIMCRHVIDEERPLLEVWHLPDGTWDFMCGEDDHETDDDADVVCADCALRILSESTGLSRIERGTMALRESASKPWNTREMTQEEIAECFEEN